MICPAAEDLLIFQIHDPEVEADLNDTANARPLTTASHGKTTFGLGSDNYVDFRKHLYRSCGKCKKVSPMSNKRRNLGVWFKSWCMMLCSLRVQSTLQTKKWPLSLGNSSKKIQETSSGTKRNLFHKVSWSRGLPYRESMAAAKLVTFHPCGCTNSSELFLDWSAKASISFCQTCQEIRTSLLMCICQTVSWSQEASPDVFANHKLSVVLWNDKALWIDFFNVFCTLLHFMISSQNAVVIICNLGNYSHMMIQWPNMKHVEIDPFKQQNLCH